MPKRYSSVIFYILLLAIINIFVSCDNNPASPNPDAVTIQPLAVGSSWTYSDSIFIDTGVLVDTTRIKIGGKGLLHNQINQPEVFYWEVYSGSNQLLRTNLIYTEETGLVHYGEIINDDTLYAQKYWGKYPINVGDKFDEDRYSYDPSSGVFTKSTVWTWECISKNEPVQTASGEVLTCVVFQAATGENELTRIFYAVNVGYAGWQTIIEGKTVFRETLAYFYLAG